MDVDLGPGGVSNKKGVKLDHGQGLEVDFGELRLNRVIIWVVLYGGGFDPEEVEAVLDLTCVA